ncbi:acylneuraminate cytidylyltransferase family protein [Streptomyces sp. NPDC048551]|uniref:acylneuraminate cytidylyltransferase family protein n=1 Tax=Streptomyces sp. NPDC048551 TaxID=3155758 RepID=UPI00341F46EC
MTAPARCTGPAAYPERTQHTAHTAATAHTEHSEPTDPAPVESPVNVTAVIPARGGSKGIPGKNVAEVGGVPLVARAVRACLGAAHVTRVAVSTDDGAIADAARAAGAEVVERPAELGTDRASSESALLHALDRLEERHGEPVEVLVFVQCTSPFVTAGEIDAAVLAVVRDGADSAFTAVPFHGFLWTAEPGPGPGHAAAGVNHDSAVRQRRQDRRPEYLESGAVYAMRAEGFRRHGHRFFGRTQLVPTAPERAVEIDEPGDLDRARALAPLLDARLPPQPSQPPRPSQLSQPSQYIGKEL